MMKSFFKKLAFVMALAMVVSLAAPAATTASAAEEAAAKKLAITYQGENHYTISEVNIANVGDAEDLRFLYAPANYKELGVKWTSSNEAVATVDESGLVTAVAAGTAVVTVAVGTESASVTVNVGTLPTYTVNIGEGDDKEVTEWTLKIGEDVDFAFYGVKDYGRDKIGAANRYACQWGTDDPTVLSNDGNGVFTALKAGTAKATLMVINVVTNQIHNVIPVLVTVEADATPTPTPTLVVNSLNETQETILLNADAKADYKLEDVELYRVFKADDDNNGDGIIDERDAVEPYQHWYVDTFKYDKKVSAWRIDTFDALIDGATYEVRLDGRVEQFVASVGPVATVEVYEDQTAVLESEDSPLVEAIVKVKLFDAKGVNVTTHIVDGFKNNDDSLISYDLVETDSAYSLGYNDIEFYEDAIAKVVATYNRDGNEVLSNVLPVKPEARDPYDVEIVTWTLVKPNGKADWTKLVTEMPAGEKDWVIATLLKDTRGDYYTTHEKSANEVNYVDADGKEHDVLWTEDETQNFWENGFYVQYKAMNPDQMLVETYGEVESYEEGRAYYSLYLYNYKNYVNEFVRELYSQYLYVCHPMELKNVTADKTVSIMMATKDEAAFFESDADDTDENDYYSKFSKAEIRVFLNDIHKDTFAKDEHASAAEFEITLLSGQMSNESDEDYAALKELVEEKYLVDVETADEDYYDYDGHKDGEDFYRVIRVEADQFADLADRNQVKFRITETTTNTSVNVTINLKKLAVTVVKDNNGTVIEELTSKVALVKEFNDDLGEYEYFEKFKLDTTGFNVEQYVANTKDNGEMDGFEFALLQSDKNNNDIGYDSNIYISTTVDAANTKDILGWDFWSTPATFRGVNPENEDDLKKGDRVLVVKDPNGKAYPLALDSYTIYDTTPGVWADAVVDNQGVKNVVYNKKDVKNGFATVATSTGLGVQLVTDYLPSWGPAKDLDDANNEETFVYGYKLIFRTFEDTASSVGGYAGQKTGFGTTGTSQEAIYAKDGRYTIIVKTVESVNREKYSMTEADDQYFEMTGDDRTAFKSPMPSMDTLIYTLDADKVNYTATTTFDPDETYYVVAAKEVKVKSTDNPQGLGYFEYNETTKLYELTSDTTKATNKKYYVMDVNENYGKVTYASSTGLKDTVYANVKNSNPEVTYAGRDLTRIDAYIEEVVTDFDANVGDDEDMKEYILKAFNFNLGGNGWGEEKKLADDTWKLSPEDILYYTYTVAPTNDQIVINTVTFKVPLLWSDWSGNYYSGYWYRATATVNKSLTFIEQ